MSTTPDPDSCLEPTPFIDSGHNLILDLVSRLGVSRLSTKERAVILFEFVRDQIEYDFRVKLTPGEFIASCILSEGKGFCVQKAVLLGALGRAAGVPTALVFCDLKDHTLPPEIVQAIGTNVLHYHGLNAFHLEGDWLLVDASLSPDVVERKGYRLVEFDGTGDALLHSTTQSGGPHAEYVGFHGMFPELPFDRMFQAFLEAYRNADIDALERLGYRL